MCQQHGRNMNLVLLGDQRAILSRQIYRALVNRDKFACIQRYSGAEFCIVGLSHITIGPPGRLIIPECSYSGMAPAKQLQLRATKCHGRQVHLSATTWTLRRRELLCQTFLDTRPGL